MGSTPQPNTYSAIIYFIKSSKSDNESERALKLFIDQKRRENASKTSEILHDAISQINKIQED